MTIVATMLYLRGMVTKYLTSMSIVPPVVQAYLIFLGFRGEVRNLGINGGVVIGNYYAGGLVGINDGVITACYATANVETTGFSDRSGGCSGGLVGYNRNGSIIACYAEGAATGALYVGGLAGYHEGFIGACYATGNAEATGASGVAGGLVGWNVGTISACYAEGAATGALYAGGLVGYDDFGTITTSYFDTKSTATDGVGSDDTITDLGKTTTELQTPTVYDNNSVSDDESSIYEAWNIDLDGDDATDDDPWDFGTSSQYPALKGGL